MFLQEIFTKISKLYKEKYDSINSLLYYNPKEVYFMEMRKEKEYLNFDIDELNNYSYLIIRNENEDIISVFLNQNDKEILYIDINDENKYFEFVDYLYSIFNKNNIKILNLNKVIKLYIEYILIRVDEKFNKKIYDELIREYNKLFNIKNINNDEWDYDKYKIDINYYINHKINERKYKKDFNSKKITFVFDFNNYIFESYKIYVNTLKNSYMGMYINFIFLNYEQSLNVIRYIKKDEIYDLYHNRYYVALSEYHLNNNKNYYLNDDEFILITKYVYEYENNSISDENDRDYHSKILDIVLNKFKDKQFNCLYDIEEMFYRHDIEFLSDLTIFDVIDFKIDKLIEIIKEKNIIIDLFSKNDFIESNNISYFFNNLFKLWYKIKDNMYYPINLSINDYDIEDNIIYNCIKNFMEDEYLDETSEVLDLSNDYDYFDEKYDYINIFNFNDLTLKDFIEKGKDDKTGLFDKICKKIIVRRKNSLNKDSLYDLIKQYDYEIILLKLNISK